MKRNMTGTSGMIWHDEYGWVSEKKFKALEIKEKIEAFVASQEDSPPEFDKILQERFWELLA